MNVFIDTSAFLAVLDADDANHAKGKHQWTKLVESADLLLTSNYVLVETFALVQHRLGMEAVRALEEDLLPVVAVEWVEETAHKAGINSYLAAGRRKLSLVDCVSFATMRRLGLRTAFTFDADFRKQGFMCLP